jgi:hypothetical protein
VPLKSHWRHVFLYLATRDVPNEFRVFLLRHADLLKSVDEWTIRVLLPRRFRKAAALHRYAIRDAFMMPLTPRDTEELDWYFRARRGEVVCPSADRDLDLTTAAQKFGAARFEALYRMWQQRDVQALWAMQGPTLRDQLQRGLGRVEFAELPHQTLKDLDAVGGPRQSRLSQPVDTTEFGMIHVNPARSAGFQFHLGPPGFLPQVDVRRRAMIAAATLAVRPFRE